MWGGLGFVLSSGFFERGGRKACSECEVGVVPGSFCRGGCAGVETTPGTRAGFAWREGADSGCERNGAPGLFGRGIWSGVDMGWFPGDGGQVARSWGDSFCITIWSGWVGRSLGVGKMVGGGLGDGLAELLGRGPGGGESAAGRRRGWSRRLLGVWVTLPGGVGWLPGGEDSDSGGLIGLGSQGPWPRLSGPVESGCRPGSQGPWRLLDDESQRFARGSPRRVCREVRPRSYCPDSW